jgi:hypothetical protein
VSTAWYELDLINTKDPHSKADQTRKHLVYPIEYVVSSIPHIIVLTGALTKLWKSTSSIAIPVRPSVHMEKFVSH